MNYLYELYAINEEIKSCIDPETGEVNDSKFTVLDMQRDEKLEQIALMVKNLRANSIAMQTEVDEFKKRIDDNEQQAAKLEELLKRELSGEPMETNKVKITFRKSESVEVINIYSIPAHYLSIPKPTADKRAIKAAIKNGELVPGAELKANISMTIK